MSSMVIPISIITAFLLIGCGGDSSSKVPQPQENQDTNESKNITLKGYSIDPAIQGANVSLKCDDKTYEAASQTDEKGAFNIKDIPPAQDLVSCVFYSLGGNDGDDLSNLVLKVGYKLYNRHENIFITPFSTLVTNNANYENDVDSAKKEVAAFLEVNSDDLLKDPTSDITLAKKSKTLTKVSLAHEINQNKQSKEILDKTQLSAETLSKYVEQLEGNKKLKEQLEAIEKAKKANELVKIGALENTNNLLKEAFMQSSYTQTQLKNFEILSIAIVESNKLNSDYRPVFKTHVRKVLKDLGITPEFSNFENKTLKPEILEILNKNEKDFNEFLKNGKYDISNFNTTSLIDVKKDKQILGNDNNKRIQYYTFSNVSHIAKALQMTKDSYDDLLLNPSYVEVAKGYAKLGFDDEANKILNENIYNDENKLDAYTQLANIAIDQQRNYYAKKFLDEGFSLYKKYLQNKGYTNLDSDDSWNLLRFYYAYYSINETTLAEGVMSFFNNEVAKEFNNNTAYGRMAVALRNMIQEYVDMGNQNYAKAIFKEAKKFVLQIPINSDKDVRSVVAHLLSIAHPGATLGLKDDVNELLAKVDSIDKTYNTAWGKLTAVGQTPTAWYAFNGDKIGGIRALNGQTDEIYKALKDGGIKGYASSTKKYWDNEDGAIEEGLAAALFIDGKKQEAIDLIYEYRPFKKYEGEPYKLGNQIFRKYAPRDILVSLDTGRQLKARDFNLMIEFYEMLVADMEKRPWSLSDLAIQKYVLNTDYGITIVAKHYHDVGNFAKRDEMINKAISIADKMSDPLYKLNAYSAILSMAKELNLPKTSSLTNMVTSADSLAANVSLDSTQKDYYTNLQVGINQSKYLALYGNLNASQTLVQKLIDSLPNFVSGDKANIEKRLTYAMGYIDDKQGGADFYQSSILSALVATKDYKKAESLIDNINSNVETLGDSLDAYLYYRSVARAYAAINNDVKAKDTINKIKTLKEKNDATLRVVKYLSNFDAFPNTPVAFVDFDGDGKPDFFNKVATSAQIAQSGLELDDDIDGDGVLDTADELPYHKNN